MRSSDYEGVVCQVAEQVYRLVEAGEAPIRRHGKHSKLRGASGYLHQIDVVCGDDNHLLLVECKFWKRRVSVEHALAFAARLKDIREASTHSIEGALATTVGFQAGCELIARHFGFELHKVENAAEFALRYRSKLLIGKKFEGAITPTGSVSHTLG
jgi:Holliday junction resolvase